MCAALQEECLAALYTAAGFYRVPNEFDTRFWFLVFSVHIQQADSDVGQKYYMQVSCEIKQDVEWTDCLQIVELL